MGEDFNRVHDCSLILFIKCRGRFVEEQDRRLQDHSTRDRDALLLAPTEVIASCEPAERKLWCAVFLNFVNEAQRLAVCGETIESLLARVRAKPWPRKRAKDETEEWKGGKNEMSMTK